MRKSTGGLLLTLLCATTLFAAGFTSKSKADEGPGLPSVIPIHGTVNQESDGRLSITRQDGDMAGQEVVLLISDKTMLLDAVNGYPQTPEALKSGDTVYAYVSPAMTLSLPPITNAELILCGIPAGFHVPDYVTIESVTVNDANTSGTIKTQDGKTYTVPEGCQLLPYLTRNIVTLRDLVKGQKCLIWTQADGSTAAKLVAFAVQPATGWVEADGSWHYYDADGSAHTGWLNEGGDWYYLNPDTGIMQTGFLTLDGKTYYLLDSGKMLTTAKTFTPDKDGALH